MGRSAPNQSSKVDFTGAARQRWQALERELGNDVTEFNSRHNKAELAQMAPNQVRVTNLHTGLELIISADFEARTVRYSYQQVNDKSAGTPEGGMLSMRLLASGGVEFFSADEQLTSEETRKILLEAVLFPPPKAAGTPKIG